MTIRIMLETNVIKFSATKLERLIPVNRPTRNAKGEITGFMFYEPGYINPNDRITNPEQKREADLLPQIAKLARTGDFELLLDSEAIYESWGVRKINSADGPFYGAPITDAQSPVNDGIRVLFGPGLRAKEWTEHFLVRIQDQRFKELAKRVGGYQGPGKYNLNQLRDAYYVWSAEHNHCDYFLTMDFKLIGMLSRSSNLKLQVKVVRPSELLEQTGNLTKS